ncbi:helix-hairpin-helix domain-containing protein [Paucibacter sp. R3-3]|uniref:Helix-hairpin-helix domain-containing protein n=1 Tax=Roseateles agri TaxID=3098619 RepID=A0ABU5DQ30_9BURK|nr:helix-hairpin-helix domain-containing protein [Paucibacter sp. R3-3]MDY0748429.1 helix-hairpin-helix domain-containing protein [Paucibacter sp. R3-3]
MAKTLVTSKGAALQLARELGKGGEGSVYEVIGLSDQVAKLYHKPPDAKKQSKLTFMAATADAQLVSYAAWPQETLHASKGGPVVGFLMPKVVGREPIHMVYSPAHRRQERPKAAWDYLLFVARNTASAFETVHDHGHVLGDVNQGNVMVGGDSKVILIDCDSCQVDARGTLHLCEVGVSHYTPPELQGLSSFDGVVRKANHDNFGLALLIFHLLFGGRHPYSGVPLRNGVGDALEADIKAFRYAYARDAKQRGFSPPPRSIPLDIVPDAVQSMFHAAFTEVGSQGGRPTAKQWVSALDGVRANLKRCGTSGAMHVYPKHLLSCPWCALERQGVVYFLDLGATYTPTSTGFILAKAWALIEAVPPPPVASIPSVGHLSIKPNPLPVDVPGKSTVTAYRVLAVGLAVFVAVIAPKLWFWCLAAGFVGWNMLSSIGSGPRSNEWRRRKDAKAAAQQEYDRLVKQLQEDTGPQGFSLRRQELIRARDEYQGLPQREKQELDKLHATAEERQKQKFLDGIFIDSADITGVGPARKAALRSFGIETAADVDWARIRQVRGFGESLTRAVVDWRASCERRFRFNPSAGVAPADIAAIKSRLGARRVALEAVLGSGAADLQRFRQTAESRAAALQPALQQAVQALAQATADLAAM